MVTSLKESFLVLSQKVDIEDLGIGVGRARYRAEVVDGDVVIVPDGDEGGGASGGLFLLNITLWQGVGVFG